MVGVFREMDCAVSEFEAACESLVEVDYPSFFEGVNGGGDEPSYEERCAQMGLKPWWGREGVPFAGLFKGVC